MKISYGWLKEYVDVKLSPEKLAEALTMAGLSVESVAKKGADYILEIEITANRPDWLSYIGVAREVAALTGRKLKIPPCVVRDASCAKPLRVTHNAKRTTIRIEDKVLCPRYTARVINGVRVAGSPAWLVGRLDAMGLRPVNNIVDITNFCLFETGEPMHAFDLDKIEGDVIVRKARQGEKIVGIDGAEKALDGSMLVIADRAGPIAIAGVMGGLRTEVTGSTKNILLEAAYFDPVSVRRTSRKLGLSTESSYRFERKVSVANIEYASDRATALIKELSGGAAGEFTDIGIKGERAKSIELDLAWLEKILGRSIAAPSVKKILTSLGLKVTATKHSVRAAPPDFRQDLKAPIDLVEEVARVYGYNNLPSTIPAVVDRPLRGGRALLIRRRIAEKSVAMGFYEVKTYTLLSRKHLSAGSVNPDLIAEIANPLSAEQEAMRTTMLPGMLLAAQWNINRKSKDLKLFEMGEVYAKKSAGGFSEREALALCVAGQKNYGWDLSPRPATFFDLKGAVQGALDALGITGAVFMDAIDARFADGSCASVGAGGQNLGIMGEVARKVCEHFDIKDRIYFAEICLTAAADSAVLETRFSALPKHQAVLRDISILVPDSVKNAGIIGSIRASAGPLLKKIELIDRYTGKQVPGGKISLTYRLEYLDPDRTLEEKEVNDVHSRVLLALERDLGAKQR